MSTKRWPRRDPIKNYFPLPNELYSLGLSHSAIAIYGFLLRRENRKTWQCVLSYRTIGEAVHLSVNTVRKYVAELEERQLIRTERTTVITRDGRRQNGCLRYTVLPIQMAIDDFHGRQLRRAEELQERWLAAKRTEGQGEGGGGPC